MARTPRCLLLVAALATRAAAKSYNVRSSTDLTAAFAQLASGDTVNIKDPGTYRLTAPLTLTNLHTIKINGRSQLDAVIDGSGVTRLLELRQAQDVELKNIVLQNGMSDESSQGGGSGGALLIDGSSNIELEGVHVATSTSAVSGGAVVVFESSRVTFDGCVFTGNRAANAGGALAALDTTQLRIVDSSFTGNIAAIGGALGVRGGERSSASGNSFTGNQATEDGGAIGLYDAGFFAIGSSNSFSGNSVQDPQASQAPLFVQTGSLAFVDAAKDGGTIRAQCAGWPEREAEDQPPMQAPVPVADSSGSVRVSFSRLMVYSLEDKDKDSRHATRPDLSDPFVVIHGAGGSYAKTAPAKNTGNVTWLEETLSVDVDPLRPVVLVEVLDDDGKHAKLLGHVLVELGASGAGGGAYALHGPRKHDGDGGHGGVRLTWEADDMDAWRAATGGAAQEARAEASARWQMAGSVPRGSRRDVAPLPLAVAFGAGIVAGIALAAAAAAIVVVARRARSRTTALA